jgi:hypothetical protein
MGNMEQKVVGNGPGNTSKAEKYELDNPDLGLDADHSSAGEEGTVNYNNDNEMMSHNPDGEDDDHDYDDEEGHSPLMNK